MLATSPLPSGSVTATNTTGMVLDARCSASDIAEPDVMIIVGAERTSSAATAGTRAAGTNPQWSSIRILRPSTHPNFLNASRKAAWRARLRNVGEVVRLIDEPGQAARLLRARGERQRGRGAAESQDELAAVHSITSSARASNVGGTSRPSALAVLRLMSSSYLVGACT